MKRKRGARAISGVGYEMTTEQINELVKERDVGGLRRLLLSHADDTRQLIRIFNYLTLLPSIWLRGESVMHQLNHIWFLVFKKRCAGELLAAFEYDYYAHQMDEMRGDARNEAYLVIDFLLGVNFASAKGPRPGVYGKEFFLREAEEGGTTTTISNAWYDTTQGDIDQVLRPSRDRPLGWTFFHIKMRRVAFWLIHEVARTRGNEAVDSLMTYATALRTKGWVTSATFLDGDNDAIDTSRMTENQLYEAMHRFFVSTGGIGGLVIVDNESSSSSPVSSNPLITGGHYSEAEWVQLVHEVLTRVDSEWDPLEYQARQEGPVPPPHLDDAVLMHFFSLQVGSGDATESTVDDTLVDLPFIYDAGDDASQAAFKTIISRTQ